MVPDEKLFMDAMLKGLSTNNYKLVVEQFLTSRGLNMSKLSSRFIEESASLLEKFTTRDISDEKFLSIIIDGKHLQKSQIVVAFGITEDGRKIVLGYAKMTRKNNRAVKELLTDLVDRGLHFEDDLLFVADGSNDLYKAIDAVFTEHEAFQKFQWYKWEELQSHLSEDNDNLPSEF